MNFGKLGMALVIGFLFTIIFGMITNIIIAAIQGNIYGILGCVFIITCGIFTYIVYGKL